MTITVDEQDISTTWGLGPSKDGYCNNLMQFPDIKDRITNDWTDRNGLQVLYGTAYLKHKEFTITFLCDTYDHYLAFLKYLVLHPVVSWYDGELGQTFMLEYLACSSFAKYTGYNLFAIKVREANPNLRIDL
jgi:hypothetical protein